MMIMMMSWIIPRRSLRSGAIFRSFTSWLPRTISTTESFSQLRRVPWPPVVTIYKRQIRYIDEREWPTEDYQWWELEDDEFVDTEDVANHYEELLYVPPEDEDEPPPSSPERIQHAKIVAQELLQRKYGKFWIKEYEKTRKTLRIFTNPHTDPEIIQLGFELLWRTMQESNTQQARPKWMREANEHTFGVPFLENYRSIALSPTNPQKLFLQPMQLITRMNDMTNLQKNFRFQNVSYGILMDVIIGKQTKDYAPIAAEKALQSFKRLAIKYPRRPALKPDVHRYTKTMQAWAVSGNADAAEKMQDLWNLMKQEKQYPNTVTYNILIRYYGGKGRDDQLDTILAEMFKQEEQQQKQQQEKRKQGDEEDDGKQRPVVRPNEITYSQAIYGYLLAKRYETAEELMEKSLQIENVENPHTISDAARLLLNHYHRQLMNASSDDNDQKSDNDGNNKKRRGRPPAAAKRGSASSSPLSLSKSDYFNKAIELYERVSSRNFDTDEIDEAMTQIISQRSSGDKRRADSKKVKEITNRITRRSRQRHGRLAIEQALASSDDKIDIS